MPNLGNIHMQNFCRIRIWAASERPVWSGLIPILEDILPVRFEYAHGTSTTARPGEVVMECFGALGRTGAGSRFSSPESSSATGAGDDGLIDLDVRFTDDPHVPFPFRGRVLNVRCQTE